ncbi:uncharacterized protein [Ptychodera flava]|uniref:uncharacterized protein isoform X9 n=1 Tax=Ptychodera flava TaxID=63121 RepID=UPI00396A69F1
MATVRCRVQYLDDTDPFSSTNFPEPSRPPFFEFNEYAPLIEQIGMVHKLLNAPHQIDDCTLQLSHTGAYLDLESSLEEQRDELEGFNRERKHSMILRTQLAVRVHGCIEKLLSSSGRELRRALFSLKQIFQDDKDLVHEFVSADGLACLIKVGAEADQNYQNYILRALGQVMLYVDGMNGVIEHNETIQWLYSLIASKFRLVVKTSLKLLLVFVEYTESNTQLLIQAINIVDRKHGHPPWHNLMLLLKDEGQDSEILAYAMTLVNKALNAIPDQDTFYDVTDALEEQGIDRVQQKYVKMRGGDPDVKEQFQIYEASLKHADGDIDIPVERQKDLRQRQRVTPESSDGEKRKSKRSAMKVSEPYRVQNTVRNLSSGLRVMDDEPVQSAQRRRRRQRSRASSSDLESSIAIQATVETPVTEKPVEQSPSSVEERKTTTPSPLESYRQRRERLLAAKNRLSYEDSSSDVNGSIESHSTHHTPVATISTSIVEETFDQNADTDVVFTATLPSSPSPNHSEEYNSFSSSRNNDKAENEDTDIMTLLTCGDSDTFFTYTVDTGSLPLLYIDEEEICVPYEASFNFTNDWYSSDNGKAHVASSASTQRSQFVQDDEIAGHFNTDDKGYHVPTLHNNALEQREKDKEDSHSTVTLDKEVLNHENTEPQLTLDNRRNDRHMRESLSGMDAKDISVINRSKELLPSISIEDEVFVEQHTNKDATSSDANRLRLNFVSQRTVTLSSSGSSPSTPTSQQELLFPSAANTSKECTAPDVSLRSEEKTRTFNTDQKTFSAEVQSTEKEEDHSSVDKLTSQKQQFEAEEDSDVMKLLSTGFGSVSDVKTKNVPETTSQDQSLSSTSLGAENSDFDTVVTLKWGDNTSEDPSYSEYNRQPSNEKHETPRASRSSLRGVRLQSSRSQSSVEDCTELFSEKSHIPLEPSAETNVDISEQVNLCTAVTSNVKYATEILEGSREEDHDISTIDKTKTLRLAVGENDTSVSKEEDVIVVEPAEILYESVSVCVTEKPKLNQALVHENKKKVRCMSLSEEEFIEDEFSKEDIDSFEIEKIKIGSLSEIGDEWNAIHVNTEIVFQEPIVTVSPKVELKAAGCTELEIFTAAIKEQERISEGEYIEESDDNQKSQMTKDTLMEIVDENSSEDVESSQRYRPSSRKWQEEEEEEEDIMSFLSRGYSARRSRRTIDDDEDDVLKMLSQGVTEPTVEDDIPQVYVEEDKFMAHDVQDSEEAVDEPVVEFKVVIDEQKQSREDSVKHESQEEVSHDKEDEYLSIRERRRRRRAAEIVSAEIQNVDIEEQTEDTDTDEGTTSVSLEYYESGDTDTSFLETDSEAAFADDEEDDVMAFLSGGFSASRRRRQYYSASDSDHDDDVMKLLSVGDSDSEVTVTLPAARPQEVSSFEDSHDEIHVQIPYKERVQEVAVPEARVDEREDEEDTLKGSSDDDSDTTLEMEEYLNDYEREYEIEELPPEEAFIRPLKLALMEDREEGYDENDEVAESVSDNVDIVVDRRLDTIPEVEEVEDDDVRRWQSESDTAYGSAPESEGSSPDDDEDIRLHRETDEKILERKAVSYKVKEPEKGEEEEDDVMQFLSRGFTGGRSYGRMAKTAVEEESEDDIMKLLCQGFAESVPEEPVSKAPKESQEDVKLERIDARSLHEEKEEDEFALRKTVESESRELSDSSEESEEDELEELEKLEIIEESDISDVTAEDVDVDDGESETSYYSRSRGSKWADEDEYVPRLSRRSRYSDHSYEEYDNEDDIMALLSGGDSSLSESMTSVTDLSGTEFDERYTSEEEPEVIICRARELELMEERYYVPNILEEYDLYSESEKAEITLHVAEEICDKRIFAFGVGITEMICEDFEDELKEEVFMDKERCATETFINACELQQRDNVTEVVLWQSEEIPIGYTASIDDVEEFLMEDQAEEIVVDVRDAALEALAGISLSESGWKEVSSKIEETAELLKQMVDRGASVPSDTFQLVKSDDATAASIKDLLSHLSAFNSFFLPAALMASVTAYALGIFMPAFSAGLYIGNCLRPSSKTGTRKGPVVPVISTSPTVEEPSSGSSVYPIHKIVLPDTAAVDLDKNEDLDFLQLIEPGDSDVFDKDDKFVTVPAGNDASSRKTIKRIEPKEDSALAATIKHYKQHRSEGDERDYRPSYLKQKPADLTADVGSDFVQVQKDYYNMLSDTYVLASLSHAGSDRSKQKSDSASLDRETSPRQKSTTSDIQEREHKSPKPKKESENSTEAELPMGPIWPKQKPEDGDTPDRRSTKRLVATNSFTDLLLSGESDSLVSDSEYGTDPFTDEASDHDYYSKNRSQDRDNKSEPPSTRRKRSKHGRSRRKHSRSAEGTLSHQRRKSKKSDNVSPERQISLCPQPPSSPSPQQHQSLPKSYNWVDEYSLSESSDSDVSPETIEPMEFDQEDETDLMALLSRGDSLKTRQEPRDENYISYHARMKQQRQSSGRYAERKTDVPSTKTEQREGRRSRQYRRKDMSPVVTDDDPDKLNVSKSRFRNRFEEVPSEKEMRNEGLKERDSCSLSSSSSSGSSLRDEDRKSPSPSCISSTSTASNESTEGSSSSAFTKGVPPPSSTVDPRRRPIMNSDFSAQLEKPELERMEQERSERIGDSSQDQVLSNNKRLFLAMMGSKMKSVDDEEDLPKEARPLPTRRISQCLSATESLGDRIENLQSSTGEVTRTVQDNIDNAGAVMNAQERLSQSTVDESGDKGPLGPTGDRTGVIGQAIEGLHSVGKSPTCSDSEQHKAAAPPKREVDERWDQLLASTNRALKIKDLDFTDLAASDDEDVLEPKVTAVDSATVGGIPPPPPPPPLGGPPPPPPAPPAPPHLFGVPPPPPLFGMTALDGKVPGKPSDGTLKKSKKTLKLFWKEVRNNSPFMSQKSPVKTTIWNTLDPVELDTTKLEHLFESRTKELSFKKMEEATQKKEVTVLDAKRSNAINIGMTVLPSIRTIKPAILNMDSVAMNREAIEKILTMMPTDEEKSKIKEASLANPDLPLGTAEQFLITLGSISELNARLNLWMFKLDYDSMEQEVAEPLMDLKKGMEDLKENKTFRRILSMLLAIGNFLNDAQHKGFQLDYLAKVPEVKDTVRKQSLLYHLCIMMMEKFPESSDLYSEIGPITRCSKVEFDQISENLTTMEKRCKESWEHLKAIAKHDSHSELRFRLQSFLGDCAERIIVLKTVHRRVINRFHKLLLYMGMTPQAIKEVKIGQFCRIISEFALEYRTVRERALDVQKKKANQRERNKTRGKLISDTKNFSKVQDKDDHDKLKKLLKNTGTAPGDEHLGRSRSRAQGHYAGTPDDDDAPDEMMELLVKSATAPSNRHTPRERKRARQSNRKSLRRTLKSGLTPEEKQALGMGSRTEVRV